MNKTTLIFTLGFALTAAITVRSLFPIRTETVVLRPPTIRYDTVKSIDTVWVQKLRRSTDTLWLERLITAQPETIYALPTVTGLRALLVPQAYGDTMIALGFQLKPSGDSAYISQQWSATWVYPGPLKALLADTFPPRASFWPAPPPVHSCGLFCKLSHYAVGGAGGYALCRIGG